MSNPEEENVEIRGNEAEQENPDTTRKPGGPSSLERGGLQPDTIAGGGGQDR